MNRFQACLKEQLQRHPVMQARDVVKLCYQAACGAEHLLSDMSGAYQYFCEEYEGLTPYDGDLYEQISQDVCRVNMACWKYKGLPKEWLFRIFTGTVFDADGKARLEAYLSAAEEVLNAEGFDMPAWYAFLEIYRADGMPAVRHTEAYRAAEKPAYRIVNTAYLPLLPVLERIAGETAHDRSYVIVIDGKAGAGKSTLAEKLRRVLDAGMVYMDDFFLPPELRTRERLDEVGGNIHYERFAEQVLPYVGERAAFDYEVFDCSRMALNGTCRVSDSPFRIVEGSYAHHPRFGDYGNLRLFVDIDADTQLQRIVLRNGEAMAERFRTQWIPMENRYFETYDIRARAHLVIE